MKNRERTATTVAIGSSMTQNNLHSETVISNLHTRNYLNTSSWGMSMHDNFVFLKSLCDIYKIERVLIVSNIIDFQQTDKHIDIPFVESYLKGNTCEVAKAFIEHFDLKYYTRNLTYAKKVRSCDKDYEYLKYDRYGAVNFRTDSFNIDKERWENDYLSNPGLAQHYQYLDSIAAYCKVNGIELLFFQSPERQDLAVHLDSLKSNNLKQHLIKIKHILETNNQTFVDSNEKLWQDTLFTDAIHFNKMGSQLFTEFCFDKMKQCGSSVKH
ncbi:hypothetical protein [Cytophaga aurantiaca]|uniref:hypothetical protein n=1 Tax=Cytophaga aurantiaca TaxID=29530 RepID=UPI0012F72BFB|nr:hypothetical protein [Cytophaga aurantiaca]